MPLLITISSAGPSSWEEVTKWRTGRLQHHLPHWKHWKPDNSQISGKACKLSKKSHLIAQCFSSTDDNGKASKVWGDHSRHWGQLWWPRAVHSDGNSAQLQRAQKRGARKEKGGAPAGTAHHQLDTGQFQNHPAYPDCLHCLATTVINICPILVTIGVLSSVLQVTEEKPEAAEADPEPAFAEVKSRFVLPLTHPSFPVFTCPCPTQTQFKT